MFTKTVIASIARRLGLAGFSLLLIARCGAALGAEPESLKRGHIAGPGWQADPGGRPRRRGLGPVLLLDRMPDLQRVQPHLP